MIPKRYRDLAACLAIGFACIVLRTRSLDEVTLNPDESQYEATASYLLSSGQSGFAIPYGTHATFELYRLMALAFGPYCMFEMRVLVTAICVAMGCGMYWLLRESIGRPYALFSGLWLVHYNAGFEGDSANREWFAAPLLLLAMGLALRAAAANSPARILAWSAAAGFAAEFSLWFKEQGIYFAALLPVVFVLDGWAARQWRRPLLHIVGYGAGAAAGAALALAIFLHYGILGLVIENARAFAASYASETTGAGEQAEFVGKLSLRQVFTLAFFDFLRFRTTILLAYGCAVVVVVYLAWRLGMGPKGELSQRERIAVLLVLNLVGALWAVQVGRRFFFHYYLFALVPLAGLSGLALSSLANLSTERLGSAIVRLLVALVLFVDCEVFRSIREHLRARSGLGAIQKHLWFDWKSATLFLGLLGIAVLLIVAVIQLAVSARRHRFPSNLLQLSIVGIVLLDFASLAVWSHERPVSLYNLRLERLTEYLKQSARPGDRLFVWGWLPQIYSLTRMDAATQFGVCAYIVQDFTSRPAPPILSKDAVDRMFADLKQFPPRFIVDASNRSIAMSRSLGAIYHLRYFPEFEAYLAEHYQRVERIDDCAIYQRR